MLQAFSLTGLTDYVPSLIDLFLHNRLFSSKISGLSEMSLEQGK